MKMLKAQQMLLNLLKDGAYLPFVPEQMDLFYFRSCAILVSTIAKLSSPMEQIDDESFFF